MCMVHNVHSLLVVNRMSQFVDISVENVGI